MKYKYICGSCGIESMSDTPFEVKVDEDRIKRNKYSMEWYMNEMDIIDDELDNCFKEIDNIISENNLNRSKLCSDMDEYNKIHILKRHIVENSDQLRVYTFFGSEVFRLRMVEEIFNSVTKSEMINLCDSRRPNRPIDEYVNYMICPNCGCRGYVKGCGQ